MCVHIYHARIDDTYLLALIIDIYISYIDDILYVYTYHVLLTCVTWPLSDVYVHTYHLFSTYLYLPCIADIFMLAMYCRHIYSLRPTDI